MMMMMKMMMVVVVLGLMMTATMLGLSHCAVNCTGQLIAITTATVMMAEEKNKMMDVCQQVTPYIQVYMLAEHSCFCGILLDPSALWKRHDLKLCLDSRRGILVLPGKRTHPSLRNQ